MQSCTERLTMPCVTDCNVKRHKDRARKETPCDSVTGAPPPPRALQYQWQGRAGHMDSRVSTLSALSALQPSVKVSVLSLRTPPHQDTGYSHLRWWKDDNNILLSNRNCCTVCSIGFMDIGTTSICHLPNSETQNTGPVVKCSNDTWQLMSMI